MLQITLHGPLVADSTKKGLRDLASVLAMLPDAWMKYPVSSDSSISQPQLNATQTRVLIPASIATTAQTAWSEAMYALFPLGVSEPFALSEPTALDAQRSVEVLLDLIRQVETQGSPSMPPPKTPTSSPTPRPTIPTLPPPPAPPKAGLKVPWYAWALGIAVVGITSVAVVALRRPSAGVA